MIIKNIYHKIKIHPFFYLTSFIVLMTGNFKEFTIFMILLLIHECGHILVGIYFKWNIESVMIFPFGALTVFKDHLNKPIKEELLIVLMGPIFQCLCYLVLCLYQIPNLETYHYGLLLFNLLPITPLDGSKIWVLIYQRFFSYFYSQSFLFIFSIFHIILLYFISKHSLVLYFILMILISKVIKEFKSRHMLFSKFILERTLYPFQFPRRKIIKGTNIKKMKRDTKHLFYINKNYYTERAYLQKIFDFKGKKW